MAEEKVKRAMIEVKGLVRSYAVDQKQKKSDGDTRVLKGIDFIAVEEEFIGIMGKSGCGKTTFLKVLGLLDKPTEGTVIFKDIDTDHLWKDELADIRRREIGFVFQDFYLMDSLSVQENMILPMILDKAKAEDMHRKAAEYAGHFGISHLLLKAPYELSGGEKQRVAICRALINDPDLVLADEPTGNLDSKAGKVVIDALQRINTEMKKTIIMVTHDPHLASYCKKIVLLKDGEILETLLRKDGGEESRNAFYHNILNRMQEL